MVGFGLLVCMGLAGGGGVACRLARSFGCHSPTGHVKIMQSPRPVLDVLSKLGRLPLALALTA